MRVRDMQNEVIYSRGKLALKVTAQYNTKLKHIENERTNVLY